MSPPVPPFSFPCVRLCLTLSVLSFRGVAHRHSCGSSTHHLAASPACTSLFTGSFSIISQLTLSPSCNLSPVFWKIPFFPGMCLFAPQVSRHCQCFLQRCLPTHSPVSLPSLSLLGSTQHQSMKSHCAIYK